MMRIFIIGLIAVACLGCLDSDEAVENAEAVDAFAEGGADAGIPYFSLLALGTGAFAEYVRGRRNRKKLSEQAGAVFSAVDAHLNELTDADKAAAKDAMRAALEKALGKEKAGQAKAFLLEAKKLVK